MLILGTSVNGAIEHLYQICIQVESGERTPLCIASMLILGTSVNGAIEHLYLNLYTS